MKITPATPDAAAAIAALRNAVADHLTDEHGRGHWSYHASEKGVLSSLRQVRVFVARHRAAIVATFNLATKKPWAIDTAYFTPCAKALYLTNMAVDPARQHRGIGRRCLDEATRIAQDWPADAIRLDAYNTAAGAGDFYRKCGFRETGRAIYRKTPLIYFEMLL